MDWKNYSLKTQNADWAFLDEMLRRSKIKKFELSDFLKIINTKDMSSKIGVVIIYTNKYFFQILMKLFGLNDFKNKPYINFFAV